MAKTYGTVNLISSLGFSHLWRRACVQTLKLEPGHICADLMCGMGEATTLMLKATGSNLVVEAIDFCPEMTKRCQATMIRKGIGHVSVHTRNVFEAPRKSIYDRICCSFGLKTFDDDQLRRFSTLIADLLTPDGRASFVEIHVPSNLVLRAIFLFYIRHIIPAIGRLCLGDPSCYRYLALYTEDFARRDFFAEYLHEAGLQVNTRSLFFGCAKIYVAEKRRS